VKKNINNIEKFLVSRLIKKNQRYVKFDKNTNFFKSGIDSLDYLSYMFEIEKKYQIKINHSKYIKLNTINKLNKEILKKLKE